MSARETRFPLAQQVERSNQSLSAIRDPPSNRSGTRSSDKRPGTQRVRGTAEMPWVELILSRTTGCREGPSNVRLLRTFQDVALLDAGLLRCPVAGPSTSGREHLDPRLRRVPVHPHSRAGGRRRGCCRPTAQVFGRRLSHCLRRGVQAPMPGPPALRLRRVVLRLPSIPQQFRNRFPCRKERTDRLRRSESPRARDCCGCTCR